MKTIIRQRLPLPFPPQLVVFHSQIPAIDSSSSSICDSASLPTKINATLSQSQDELITKISLLLPRLCLYNHHSTAIALLDASLLTNPPPQSLPVSILSHSLASQPDFALTMSLLTRLRHHRNSLLYSTPIITALIFSYCKRRKSSEALKIFHWMLRPGSPCKPDGKVYKTLIAGLCRKKGMALDALKALRNMIHSDLVPDCELRNWVCRCLLREAMIGEAMELNEALDSAAGGDQNSSDHLRKVSELLNRIIVNWIE